MNNKREKAIFKMLSEGYIKIVTVQFLEISPYI